MRSVVRLLLLSTLFALAAGCASQKEVEVLPEQTYYENAREAMNSGNFNEAEQNLDALETYYPFGRYAEQAQLDLIFARYQNLDLEGSRAAADRFIRLNPQSEHLDYALYMRGLASYNLDLGLATRYFPVDAAARNPGEQLQAFRDFSQLLNRFPDSDYALDARQRMIAIRNRMAERARIVGWRQPLRVPPLPRVPNGLSTWVGLAKPDRVFPGTSNLDARSARFLPRGR
ncbi:outer membrane protein assembly factor BamD, partial [Marinobacter sp.]|uniref:outer membrane protein assembly factor BamD n=1 Tax=Marinobacter sp. TaxID=50741 RepID=UPI00258EC9EC